MKSRMAHGYWPPRLATLAQRFWVVMLVALTGLGLAKGWRSKTADFGVYRRAVHRFWSAQELYRASDGKMQYEYTPQAAVLLTPWGAFSRKIGDSLWNIPSVLILAWVAWILVIRTGGLSDDVPSKRCSWLVVLRFGTRRDNERETS